MERKGPSKPFWETLPAKAVPVRLRRRIVPQRSYLEELLGGEVPSEDSATKVAAPTGNSYDEVVLGIPEPRTDEDDGLDRTGPKMPPDKVHEIVLRLHK